MEKSKENQSIKNLL